MVYEGALLPTTPFVILLLSSPPFSQIILLRPPLQPKNTFATSLATKKYFCHLPFYNMFNNLSLSTYGCIKPFYNGSNHNETIVTFLTVNHSLAWKVLLTKNLSSNENNYVHYLLFYSPSFCIKSTLCRNISPSFHK